MNSCIIKTGIAERIRYTGLLLYAVITAYFVPKILSPASPRPGTI